MALPGGPGGRSLPYGSSAPRTDHTSAEAYAERIARLLQERATAARTEAAWAGSTADVAADTAPAATATVTASGRAEPLTSTWSRRALAALLIPALILLIVILL